MIILGIETSCDETALALIETREQNGIFQCRVISSLVHSQADLHSPYGGVFPTLAKREHEKHLGPLFEKIRSMHPGKIDLVAVTEGPGLEPALWTGIVFAEKLSKELGVPIIPINHMEGHIVGSLLASDKPGGDWQALRPLPLPALALLISGGHTELVKVDASPDPGRDDHPRFTYTIIGQTKDDAVGEAFDKSARLLGLPYPGGPKLSALAQEARKREIVSEVKLPRPMISSKDLSFSFSGLKTAVLYAIRDAEKAGALTDAFRMALAREFEEAVAETLDSKLRTAIDQIGARSVLIGGGVSANALLRSRFVDTAGEYGIPLFLPSQHISGDNALMIALAGALQERTPERPLKAHGTKKLGSLAASSSI